jgi:DDE superfamily endonuclease
MKFDHIKNLSDEKFRRLTGVKRKTFEKMLEILTEKEKIKKSKGGRPSKLSLENRLLMVLEYLREYRTYFHIGESYGVSESVSFKIIKYIEDTLIKSQIFSLPGKKELAKADNNIEVILIDATESPIERPKKNKKNSFLERRSAIL